MTFSISRITRSILLTALITAGLAQTPAIGQGTDPTLATYGTAKVTQSDYEASLLRIPERDRFGYAMSQDRVNKEIENLIRTRSIAEHAKRQGLDADPVLK